MSRELLTEDWREFVARYERNNGYDSMIELIDELLGRIDNLQSAPVVPPSAASGARELVEKWREKATREHNDYIDVMAEKDTYDRCADELEAILPGLVDAEGAAKEICIIFDVPVGLATYEQVLASIRRHMGERGK